MLNNEIENSLFDAIESIYSHLKLEKDYSFIENCINKAFRDYEYENDNNFLFIRTCDYLGFKVKELNLSINNLNLLKNYDFPIFIYSEKLKKYISIISYSKLTRNFTILIFSEKKEKLKMPISKFKNYFSEEIKIFFVIPKMYFTKNISPLKRLIEFAKTSNKDIFIIFLYSIIIGILSLVIPTAIQSLVNTIAFAVLLQPLIILTLIVFFFLSFSGIISVLKKYTVEIIQRRLFVNISLDLAQRINKVKINEFDKNHGPELVNRFFDILTVQKSASVLLIDGLTIAMQTITGMLLLAFYHPILLIFDILIFIWIFIILFVLSRTAIKTSIKESKAKYIVAAWLEELALYFKTFKNFNSKEYAFSKINTKVRQYIEYRIKHFKVILRIVIGAIGLQVFASSALLGIGGWLVMQQQLSIGQLVASEIVLTSIVYGFTKFGKQLEVFYDLIAAVDKLGILLDLETIEEKGEIIKDNSFKISIHSASFSFDENKIFENINIDIYQNSKVLIIGNCGSGKTTLIELLYGLRLFDTGYYSINDLNINRIDRSYLREHIYQISTIDIFEGTVEENIRLGKENIQIKEIIEILKNFNLGKKLLSIKDGLDLKLSSGGSPLSYTMCLELLLVRALISKPKVLLLDCTLDFFDDDILEFIFENLFKNMTIIATSYNNRLSKYFDRIFKINNFNLEEIL
ncbi:MAG: ATP-binding cassette domain-containing protein [Candidatus Woesearchaeota archaeon]